MTSHCGILAYDASTGNNSPDHGKLERITSAGWAVAEKDCRSYSASNIYNEQKVQQLQQQYDPWK